ASVPATSLAADMHQGSEAQSFEAAARRVTQQVKAMEKQFDDSFKFDDLIQPAARLQDFAGAAVQWKHNVLVEIQLLHFYEMKS
ncbi:unnamed protein product, partial [Symbiodinium pilosum]